MYTRSAYAEKWATTQNNLGTAYSDRLRGERAQNLEQAIACYEAALEVRTRSAYAEDWAMTQNNLGNAYLYRLRGERAQNLERAIACYEAALEVYTPSAYAENWAMTQENLAYLYIDLDQPTTVLQHLQACLEVLTPSSFPLSCLKAGRNLGNFAFNRQDWENAIYGYDHAIRAIEQSRYWATSEKTKRELIADSLDIYENMVQACIHQQDYAQALLTVERSKSRTLTELLDSANLYPKNATDRQKQQISDLRSRLAIYQQQLAFTSSDTSTNPLSPATIRQQIEAANQDFQNLLEEIGDPTFTLTQKPPTQLPNFSQLLDSQTALIEWYLPNNPDLGFYAFLIIPTAEDTFQIIPHHFTNRQQLDQAIRDYRSDYNDHQTWLDKLDQRLQTLSPALNLPDLLTPLQNYQRLILVPHRELHLIPLHALPVFLPSPGERGTGGEGNPFLPSPGGRGAGGEGNTLQDQFPIQYAPSCQFLNILHQRPPLEEPSSSFFALQNPTEDLAFAEFEVEVLRSLFNPEKVLSRHQATKANLEKPENQAFLQQSRYIHLSCHGQFNQDDPLNSYLRLANQEKLTFQDIFARLNIPNCRLLILSACKTALVETSSTDDYVGLASAFFYAGTRTVVASLWEAEEFSAALLMIRLYQELPHYTSVVLALQAAQDWLRTISRDDVLTWLKDDLKLDEAELRICKRTLRRFEETSPFASARYWAAFTASGR
ncbi:CHAT domain-containing protein [Roseofilum sp. BLCC_M154]|uniref:CHAT domain-containing protein n=1 Tax=Roseofilum acuticapitatum BLCC-M154 TaxID=3022444 RepID=A0ABT7B007_9CYAN|nr:CHAT domain-containing tetratricopeptide repeat protein [Roseofilum acuticapitatum]MDJ1172147.1 CHAT domain-containing protein [Roseofilum acuticapitatum BLCC-M154]